jgi:hypothetical protein
LAVRVSVLSSPCTPVISETNRMVLSGMQNRTYGPYLAAINKILISLMRVEAVQLEGARTTNPHPPCSCKKSCTIPGLYWVQQPGLTRRVVNKVTALRVRIAAAIERMVQPVTHPEVFGTPFLPGLPLLPGSQPGIVSLVFAQSSIAVSTATRGQLDCSAPRVSHVSVYPMLHRRRRWPVPGQLGDVVGLGGTGYLSGQC